MTEKFDICGYCRISVDEEQDRDNTSIENQRAIISDFVAKKFPNSTLEFYEDRDRSGYTFEQREGYQVMRRELMSRKKDILIVKDFSRFSRRNSRGLVELEDLRDAGCRIISIGDNIDFPNDDDWLKIQFQFLINEMPVTDTSRKVRSVIKRRQADAKWICSAPYGYIINKHKEFELVPEEADVVRTIYQKYLEDWGYKKIANYLTDENIPTPRMSEKLRKESEGGTCKYVAKREWSIVTVQGILDNDFYIGTFRQGKFTRTKINGKDKKIDDFDHIVFENHHQPIIDYRTFRTVKEQRAKRTKSHFRGKKVNDNVYSGSITCGDCGSPMFAMSRRDLPDAYRCGLYHQRGLKGCSSHHIRAEKLDELIKFYVAKVKDNSTEMIEVLNQDLKNERKDIKETETSMQNLEAIIDELGEELKVTKRQRVRDIIKKPEQEETLNEIYDELESELLAKIDGLKNQIELSSNRRNTIIRVNRVAKSALEVFDDILNKNKLSKTDLDFIIDSIKIFENHIEVKLKTDIDEILQCTKELALNFNKGIINTLNTSIHQSYHKRKDKVYDVNVISNGDPLEIFTDRNGEVIFKKYSPLGELVSFAEDICESVSKTVGTTCAICDKDAIVTAFGTNKKDLLDNNISKDVEDFLQERKEIIIEDSINAINSSVIAPVKAISPILVDSEITGALLLISSDANFSVCDSDMKVLSASTIFLSKHMS